MTVVNKFNVNKQEVRLDVDIIENMSANDVSYNSSLQYDENTVGDKISELEKNAILPSKQVTTKIALSSYEVNGLIQDGIRYRFCYRLNDDIEYSITNAPSEFQLAVYTTADENPLSTLEFITDTGWISTGSYELKTPPSGATYVGIGFRKPDNSAFSEEDKRIIDDMVTLTIYTKAKNVDSVGIGDISLLQTNNKDSLVSAINEVNKNVDILFTTLQHSKYIKKGFGANNTRFRLSYPIRVGVRYIITNANPDVYEIAVYTTLIEPSLENDNMLSDTKWIIDGVYDNVFEDYSKGYYFVLGFRKKNGVEILESDIPIIESSSIQITTPFVETVIGIAKTRDLETDYKYSYIGEKICISEKFKAKVSVFENIDIFPSAI